MFCSLVFTLLRMWGGVELFFLGQWPANAKALRFFAQLLQDFARTSPTALDAAAPLVVRRYHE